MNIVYWILGGIWYLASGYGVMALSVTVDRHTTNDLLKFSTRQLYVMLGILFVCWPLWLFFIGYTTSTRVLCNAIDRLADRTIREQEVKDDKAEFTRIMQAEGFRVSEGDSED